MILSIVSTLNTVVSIIKICTHYSNIVFEGPKPSFGPPMNLHSATYQRDFSGNLVQETLKLQTTGVYYSTNPIYNPSVKQG